MKNEFEARDELIEKRKDIRNIHELKEFIADVAECYNYDYGVAPRAIAQAALATAWYLTSKMGITGFQTSFVMWDFIRGYMYTLNECGLKIVNYDEMLFPQYKHKFEKVISKETWESIQKKAREKLDNIEDAHPDIIQHWQSIVDDNVPYGYRVEE